MPNLEDRIAKWIKKEVGSAGARGVVLGLSGGIDSAVAAALCKRALGDKALGLIMPCHSMPEDMNDARLAAGALKLKTRVLDLSPVYDAFIEILPKGKRMARANLKPRLRMTALYYFGNVNNYLVCGTGNLTETMVGYCTKWGDTGADLMPLAGLLKTQVREMAPRLGVPERIIEKPPTAGLWPGQTDEGEMGITYVELDSLLASILACEPVRSKNARRVKSMMARSEHKRTGPKKFQP